MRRMAEGALRIAVAAAAVMLPVAGVAQTGTGQLPNAVIRSDAPAPPITTFENREITQEDAENFRQGHRQSMPVTPEQAAALRRDQQAVERALQERPGIVTLIDARTVTLDASEPAPQALLHPGVISNLNFLDRTGQPWPVTGWMVGDSNVFDVLSLPPPQPASAGQGQGTGAQPTVAHALHPHLAVAPKQLGGWSNLLVYLEGAPTPLVVTLRISPDTAHYRLDLMVMADGPNALPPDGDPLDGLAPGNRELVGFLSLAGIPEDARPVGVSGIDGLQAWSWRDSTWVRTRHAMISPRWQDAVRGTSNSRIYRIDGHPPVLLVSVEGRPARATLDFDRQGRPDPMPSLPRPPDPLKERDR